MGLNPRTFSAAQLSMAGQGDPARPPRAPRHTGAFARAKAARLAATAADAGREPIRLTLPHGPGKNHLYATVRGRRVLSKAGREYKRDVARIGAGVVPFAGEVHIAVDVYRPRRAGDLDGRLLALFDSLTGVAWVDDSQVVAIDARRFDDKDNPRVEVVVRAAGAAAERG